MKILMINIIIILVFSGCYTSNSVTVKNFTYCYNEKNTGLDTIININGYYQSQFIYDGTEYGSHNFIFFPDGIFLYNFALDYYEKSKDKMFGFYNIGGAEWGVYKLFNDTIKLQTIDSPGGMSWHKGESWIKIVNNETVLMLYSKSQYPINQGELNMQSKMSYLPAKFVSFDNLPDPNKSWIKKKKWFWCNKEDYKNWKKQKKQKKQNK